MGKEKERGKGAKTGGNIDDDNHSYEDYEENDEDDDDDDDDDDEGEEDGRCPVCVPLLTSHASNSLLYIPLRYPLYTLYTPFIAVHTPLYTLCSRMHTYVHLTNV